MARLSSSDYIYSSILNSSNLCPSGLFRYGFIPEYCWISALGTGFAAVSGTIFCHSGVFT
eukprot:scaffold17524_cov53-Attheya_sp.AAC.2